MPKGHSRHTGMDTERPAGIGASGRECDKGERACLAVLTVKGKYAGDKATHDRHVERFKNFMRSPVNF